MKDEIFAVKPEKKIPEISNAIKTFIITQNKDHCVRSFIAAVDLILNALPASYASRCMEEFTKKFHKLLQKELKQSWEILTSNIDIAKTISSNLILLHYVANELLRQLLQFRNSMLDSPIDKLNEEDLKLDKQEENTLRYVAGYIPFSLLKMFEKRPDSPGKTAIVAVLHSWSKEQGGPEMSFLDYTRSWVERRNQGGLFLVNDDFYIFIRRVENVGRKLLNKSLMVTYAGEDLRAVLLNKFNDSKLITLSWESLTRNVESDIMSNKLKHLILSKWINIRANAFIKAYINIIKLKSSEDKEKKVDNKGTPALRKTLN